MHYPARQERYGRRGEPAGREERPRRFEAANGDRRMKPVRSYAFSLLFVASAALGGAALPFAFGEMFPRSFTATTVIGLENREATDGMAARLKSGDSLDEVVRKLDLAREPSLAPEAPGRLAVAADLLTGGDATAVRPATALRGALASTLSVMPDRQAGQLSLAVTTADSALSVRIANALAREGVDATAAQALDDAHGLTAAQNAADEAERALADFTAANGGADIDGEARLRPEIEAHDAEIASREAALATLKSDSARISAMKLSDALAGSADLGLEAPLFEDARQKYTMAKLELDRLAADLGPRHPRLLVARSTAEEARNRLQDALRTLDTLYRDKVKVASRALDAARAARASLDTGAQAGQQDLDAYETLKREAERLRADYLDKVDISRAAPLPPNPARILLPARAETVIANGPSPMFVAVAGAGLGLLAAFGWLFLTGGARLREEEDAEGESREMPFVDVWPQGRGDYAMSRAREREDWRDEDWRDEDWRDEDWGDEDGDDDFRGPPPAENDDEPLAERLRALLRRSAEMDYREAMRAQGPDRQRELEEIRSRMAHLRQRVETYQARRTSGPY